MRSAPPIAVTAASIVSRAVPPDLDDGAGAFCAVTTHHKAAAQIAATPTITRARLRRGAFRMSLNSSRLVEGAAPLPTVGWPSDGAHPQPVIFRVAARVARDDHVVARLQRLARHALAIELEARAPLDRVAYRVTRGILALDVHERVGITEQELHQVAFDRFRLVLEVRRRERVVRVRRHRHIANRRG